MMAQPVQIINDVLVKLAKSTDHDAFGRLRVSDPVTVFDFQAQYDKGPLLWEEQLTGSGTSTHDGDTSSVQLAVTTASGDKVIRQSRQYIRYQPSKSQFALMTGEFNTGKTNLRQRWGLFDDNNGVFLQDDEGTVSFVIRSNATGTPVDTTIAQSTWNAEKLDANSGLTLDLTKATIFWVDMEWLGKGGVRFGFVIDNEVILCHEQLHANRISTVYMTTANLPIRFEIENKGTAASSSTMNVTCQAVQSEGGFESGRGLPFCKSSSYTTLKNLANDTRTPLIGIRPKATFNSITNRALILPQSVKGYAQTAGALFEVVYGGALSGGSWASVDDDSVTEANITATSISGGHVIDAFPVPAASLGASQAPGAGLLGILARLPLTLDIDGANPIEMTLCATRIGGAAADVAATMFWQEIK